MIMRRVAVMVGILLCALQLSASALASPAPGVPATPAQDSSFTLEGKITDMGAGKITVSTTENIIFHVVYSDETVIKKSDGTPGTAQDLHKGLTIAVAGDLGDSGEISAAKIDIEADGPGKQ
jgi:hypothetical protein